MDISKHWQSFTWLSLLLWPISQLFRLLSLLRGLAYQSGLLKSNKLSVPVLIVGNISVGGTGKTPLLVYLVTQLQQQGFKPGIIMRGYKGRSKHWPLMVDQASDPLMVGDEPVLLAKLTAAPVAVSPKRAEAGRLLIESGCVDLILSDDGLQHYALQRDLEIAVIDAQRGFGNGCYLPAGPLRESVRRLSQVDYVLLNGEGSLPLPSLAGLRSHNFQMQINTAQNLLTNEIRPLQKFVGKAMHAVAGIGHPQRFFKQLSALGLQIIEHAFADHYAYVQADIEFADDLPVLMTEKDAVKCSAFAGKKHWAVPVVLQFSDNAFIDQLIKHIGELKSDEKTMEHSQA